MIFQWLSNRNKAIVLIFLVIAMVAVYFCVFNKNFSYVVSGARGITSFKVSGGKAYYSYQSLDIWREIKGVNSHQMKVLSDNYVMDDNFVFYCSEDGCHRLSADPEDFSLIDLETAKDSSSLYFLGEKVGDLKGVPHFFHEGGQSYVSDGVQVWLKVVNRRDCRDSLSLLSGLDPEKMEWTMPNSKYNLISDGRNLFYLYRASACDSNYFDSWQSVSFLAEEETRKIVQDGEGSFHFLLKDSQDAIWDNGKLQVGFVSESERKSILAIPGEIIIWQ